MEEKTEELNFYNMDEYLDKQIEEIEFLEKMNVKGIRSRLREDGNAIMEDKNLTPPNKAKELKKIYKYYGELENKLYYVKERVDNLVEKCSIVLNNKRKNITESIEKLDLSKDDLNDVFKYNEYIKKIKQLSDDVSLEAIDLSSIKSDYESIEKINEDIKSNDFKYQNLDEATSILTDLISKYPKSQSIYELGSILNTKSLDIFEKQKKELKKEEKSIFISPLEKKAYTSASNLQKYIGNMLETDIEAKNYQKDLFRISNEEFRLEKNIVGLEKDSDEYKKIKEQLSSLKNERKEITEKLTSRTELFKNRYFELSEKIKEYDEKEIKFKDIKSKVEDLNLKCISASIASQATIKKENQNEEVEISEQNLDSEKDDVVPYVNQQQDNERKEETNYTEEQMNKGNAEEVEENNINDTYDAKKYIEDILNNSGKLEKLDYMSINQSINLLKENKVRLSGNQRKQLFNVINSDTKNSISKEDLEENKNDIIKLMQRLGKNTNIAEFTGEELYQSLYLYDEENNMPCVSEGLVLEADKNKVAILIEKYDKMKNDGELSAKEKEDFEKFVLNPITASMIKENISSMSLLNRIKNTVTGNKRDSYKLVNLAIDNLNKKRYKNTGSTGKPNFGEVYDSEEIAINGAIRAEKENEEKNIDKAEEKIK